MGSVQHTHNIVADLETVLDAIVGLFDHSPELRIATSGTTWKGGEGSIQGCLDCGCVCGEQAFLSPFLRHCVK